VAALADLVAAPRPRTATEPLPRPFRVVRRRRDTPDTVTLWLRPTDGVPLAFAPGQFTMLGVPGYGAVPISVSGDPARPELLQHTVRRVGDATAAITRAGVGRTLLVRGPFGTGWSVDDGGDGDLLLVAGGIGLAPLRPALLAVAARPPTCSSPGTCSGGARSRTSTSRTPSTPRRSRGAAGWGW
jgi:NAD(P)H-flavin reductase